MNSPDIFVTTPDAAGPVAEEHSAHAETTARINILLVDDEPKNLIVLETILENPGYRLVRAESADAALLALVNDDFALIVLDIQMPGMNGFELAHMVKQRRRTALIPIIFLTAHYSEDQHVLEGYETGAVDYLHKPINSFILRSKVAVFADLHRMSRASALAQKTLLAEVTERRRVQEQLQELNRTLEHRIAERTSDLSHMNAALNESEGRLRLAQHAGQVGVWEWNLQTGAGAWSDAALEVLGVQDETLDATSDFWLTHVHPADRDRVVQSFEDAQRTGEYRAEFRVIADDPKPKWVESVGAVEYQSGKPLRMCGAVRDITQRKEMELELQEANRRKDEFLAMLSHELRNPLATIRNAVSMLEQLRPDHADLNWCNDILDRQVRQLTRIVDDLLDVSRVSRGKIQLRKERLDLATVVRQAIESCRPFVLAREHELNMSLPSTPLYVEGDQARLSQVVANLLNNAAKYTERGGRIRVTLESSTGTPGQAVLRVSDNGSGISSEAMEKLFEMFYQADQNLARSDGGLGIGLSLVHRLVEMHGGQVVASSPGPGQGSEFTVTLPCAATSSSPTVPALPTVTRPPSVHLKVLVVDDNRDAAQSMGFLLRAVGHEVLLAYDGLQAVETALVQNPDVVILDIGLPEIDGYQACRRIREGGLTRQLIIAMTGYGQEEDRRLSQEAGFDTHFVKPVSLSDIEKTLLAYEGPAET